MKSKCPFLYVLLCLLVFACDNSSKEDSFIVIDSPAEIAERAYSFAELYAHFFKVGVFHDGV